MIKRIAPDKWKHFFVGLLMGFLLQIFTPFIFPSHLLAATLLTFIIVFTISYGFELFSKFTGKGHYELLDAVAAIVGGILGMSIVLPFQLVVR